MAQSKNTLNFIPHKSEEQKKQKRKQTNQRELMTQQHKKKKIKQKTIDIYIQKAEYIHLMEQDKTTGKNNNRNRIKRRKITPTRTGKNRKKHKPTTLTKWLVESQTHKNNKKQKNNKKGDKKTVIQWMQSDIPPIHHFLIWATREFFTNPKNHRYIKNTQEQKKDKTSNQNKANKKQKLWRKEKYNGNLADWFEKQEHNKNKYNRQRKTQGEINKYIRQGKINKYFKKRKSKQQTVPMKDRKRLSRLKIQDRTIIPKNQKKKKTKLQKEQKKNLKQTKNLNAKNLAYKIRIASLNCPGLAARTTIAKKNEKQLKITVRLIISTF